MALNVLMHPRNPYKERRPDFKALAEKYEVFREQVTSDAKGKIYVDYKNPASLRALSWALLKDDFQLDVKMPLDRLIPTVPLRLNYILWLEDIFSQSSSTILRGIDIGTGASCIYPLLCSQTRGWQFIATEVDPTNFEYASENVTRNGLSNKIKVVQVSEDSTLTDVIIQFSDNDSSVFDFCMCNPPFYGSNLEAWGWLTTRGLGSDGQGERTRPEPSSISTASPVESIAPGGEVQFVQQRIIESSLELRSRVRVFSTMLGKKTSVATLRDVLKMNGITNVGTTEFCQGKTMRWGLAWSFDNSIVFPKPVSKVVKAQKPRPPLVHKLPPKYTSVTACAEMIIKICADLQVSLVDADNLEGKNTSEKMSWIMNCVSNTWSHQRRKRRQQKREQLVMSEDTVSVETTTAKRERVNDEAADANGNGETSVKKRRLDSPTNADESYTQDDRSRVQYPADMADHSVGMNTVSTKSDNSELLKGNYDSHSDEANCAVEPFAGDFLLKSEIAVRKSDDGGGIILEFSWIDGQNRELLHQLLQYFKNRFV